MSSETIARAIEKLVEVHKGGSPIANLGDAAPGKVCPCPPVPTNGLTYSERLFDDEFVCAERGNINPKNKKQTRREARHDCAIVCRPLRWFRIVKFIKSEYNTGWGCPWYLA